MQAEDLLAQDLERKLAQEKVALRAAEEDTVERIIYQAEIGRLVESELACSDFDETGPRARSQSGGEHARSIARSFALEAMSAATILANVVCQGNYQKMRLMRDEVAYAEAASGRRAYLRRRKAFLSKSLFRL